MIHVSTVNDRVRQSTPLDCTSTKQEVKRGTLRTEVITMR